MVVVVESGGVHLVVVMMMDVMTDQGDCGQACTASSTSSVVPSEHVKVHEGFGGGRKGRAVRALALKGNECDDGWLNDVQVAVRYEQ